MSIKEGEEVEAKGVKNLFDKIIRENSQILIKRTGGFWDTQKARPERTTLRHLIVKT
jgi:hypothetical protein